MLGFFFHALVKIDAIRFILPNEGWRPRGEGGMRERKGGWLGGLRDTGYGTDHACEGCFHPPWTRPRKQRGWRRRGESTHSVHLRCILRKSRTCQAIRISFFIPRALAPFSAPASVDMQPFINTPCPRSSRSSFALRLVEVKHHLRLFYLPLPLSGTSHCLATMWTRV